MATKELTKYRTIEGLSLPGSIFFSKSPTEDYPGVGSCTPFRSLTISEFIDECHTSKRTRERPSCKGQRDHLKRKTNCAPKVDSVKMLCSGVEESRILGFAPKRINQKKRRTHRHIISANLLRTRSMIKQSPQI